MKVFLTGACGFLGSNIAEYLVQKILRLLHTPIIILKIDWFIKYLSPKVLKK